MIAQNLLTAERHDFRELGIQNQLQLPVTVLMVKLLLLLPNPHRCLNLSTVRPSTAGGTHLNAGIGMASGIAGAFLLVLEVVGQVPLHRLILWRNTPDLRNEIL